jgi:hypothetical protein
MSEHLIVENGGVSNKKLPNITTGYTYYTNTEGKITIVKNNTWNGVIKGEYGEEYGRQLVGTVFTEGVNFGSNLIQAAPGAGKLATVAIIGSRFLVRGAGESIGNAIAGTDDITASNVIGNAAGNALKLSKFAPTNKQFANLTLQKTAYDFKHTITHWDPKISKVKIKKAGIDQSFIIEPLSVGLQAEKKVVKTVKKAYFYKKHNHHYEIPENNLTVEWDDTDKENFINLTGGGVNEREAIGIVNDAKQKRGVISTFKKKLEKTEGFFTQASKFYSSELVRNWDVAGKSRLSDVILYGDLTSLGALAGLTVSAVGVLLMGTLSAAELTVQGGMALGATVGDAGERTIRAVKGGTQAKSTQAEAQRKKEQTQQRIKEQLTRIELEKNNPSMRPSDISAFGMKKPVILPDNYRKRENTPTKPATASKQLPQAYLNMNK